MQCFASIDIYFKDNGKYLNFPFIKDAFNQYLIRIIILHLIQPFATFFCDIYLLKFKHCIHFVLYFILSRVTYTYLAFLILSYTYDRQYVSLSDNPCLRCTQFDQNICESYINSVMTVLMFI